MAEGCNKNIEPVMLGRGRRETSILKEYIRATEWFGGKKKKMKDMD